MILARRLAVLVIVGGRKPDDEDQGDDKPARARANANPEDPRELIRPSTHSRAWWQAYSSPRADRRLTGRASFVPPPRVRTRKRAPVVKLGLCFGAILTLTAAIVAINLVNIAALQSAHERVTTGVVPRIMAAQHADTGFADTHFSQTQMVLANGALRADEEGDLKVFAARLEALRAAADDPRSMSRLTPPSSGSRTGRQAVRGRQARRPPRRQRAGLDHRRRGRRRRDHRIGTYIAAPTASARRPTSALPTPRPVPRA